MTDINNNNYSAQNQGKLASVCLQQFSSIFETTIPPKLVKFARIVIKINTI